jgi:hypothetical protein
LAQISVAGIPTIAAFVLFTVTEIVRLFTRMDPIHVRETGGDVTRT